METRGDHTSSVKREGRPPRRRKSSNLGADPRGDTGVGAIATNLPRPDGSGADSPTGATAAAPPSTASTTSASASTDRNGHTKKPRERKRTKAKKLLRRWRRLSIRHTWVNPLILIAIILSAYFVRPGEQNPLHWALFLAYANPPLDERTDTLPAHVGDVTQYGKGWKDVAFVAFYTLVFTFTREFLMQRLIRPLAVRCGIRKRGKQARFMEQAYTALYFGIFGPFGLFVMSRSPVWFFDTAGMYAGFPHRAHEAYFKAYYLLQAAYWAQQAMVLMLQLEKPRKDFKELVLHHIVTLALIGLSYRFHFTYMGVAVYITHDISDFFLATSKLLVYLDSIFVGPYYMFFMVVWGYLRHYINLCILASLLPPFTLRIPGTTIVLEAGRFATVGNYTLDFSRQQYKCWISQIITFFLIAALQLINIFWYFLMWRILFRYLFKGVQKDERSEDEEEEEGTETANGDMVKPKIAVNGQPISSTMSSVESRPNGDLHKRKGAGKR